MRLGTDGDRAGEVRGRERFESLEYENPSILEATHEGRAGLAIVDELAVSVPVGRLAIGGEPVGPAGSQVPGQVADDDGHRVDVGRGAGAELLIGELRGGAVDV